MLLNPELLSQLAPLELRARKIVEGFISGLHKSPYYGFSVEFAEHRPYNFGDDLKHVDWKVYAKTERFYVKRYEEETNLRAYLLLDTSSSMYFKHFAEWTKLRYGINFGAALLYLMHRQRDATGLIPFSDKIESFIPAKSSYSHLRLIFQELEKRLKEEEQGPGDRKKTGSAQVIHEVAERLNHRSLVVIVTDLFENVDKHEQLISALKHLRHRKHEVLLFNVMEQKSERELDFPDRRYRLEDMETGTEMEVLPAQVREDYKKKVAEYTHRFKMACSEFQIDFEEVDTQSSFDLALLAYLNKRKNLG
ncbi:DUF58 domain-containing protein [Aliifodinibius sp. S!AR15-10]|uniref:DUF58 domain-containing protein n=1 Tax=Aliifodinibius sp. S!AR15-10 TaxID=2950437 RepID=UPI0028602D35|nr:DUF58 domain-containing protein [Aliifodinibius sp. S!AR15-10]MDR8392469.1 DUF58 domain-containing protein [Aliifodinibius sp. S!AR15-10]